MRGWSTSAQALLQAAVGRPATHAAAASLQQAPVTWPQFGLGGAKNKREVWCTLTYMLRVGHKLGVGSTRRESEWGRARRCGSVDRGLHANHGQIIGASGLHRE